MGYSDIAYTKDTCLSSLLFKQVVANDLDHIVLLFTLNEKTNTMSTLLPIRGDWFRLNDTRTKIGSIATTCSNTDTVNLMVR